MMLHVEKGEKYEIILHSYGYTLSAFNRRYLLVSSLLRGYSTGIKCHWKYEMCTYSNSLLLHATI